MNRHNRGDLREEAEKKKTTEPRENKKGRKKVYSSKAACQRKIPSCVAVTMQNTYIHRMYSHIQ